ncbi:MAG TPA: hypothetical protein VN750_21140 [Steroidobacteraceae bacterium]|nr:hypothetical protein [Steroidobacteraceae bacterium]
MRRAGNGAVRHWAAPFVLAMLLLRALVPAGFMLAPVNGGLAVVLCDADSTASLYHRAGHAMSTGVATGESMSASGMAGESGHAMPEGGTTGQPAHVMSAADMGAMPAADMAGHDMATAGVDGHEVPGHPGGHTHPDPTCPYAQSSGATPIPLFAAVTPAIETAVPVFPEPAAQTHAHFGPTRQQSPRGPPHLA